MSEPNTGTCINCGHRGFWHEAAGCVRLECECDFGPSDIQPESPDLPTTEGEQS